jgi:hypothetical protein
MEQTGDVLSVSDIRRPDEYSRVNSHLCPEFRQRNGSARRRGTDQPGRRALVRVLSRRFVEEEVPHLSALQSDQVGHVLADP